VSALCRSPVTSGRPAAGNEQASGRHHWAEPTHFGHNEWARHLFPMKTLDQGLMHRCRIIETKGQSYRLRDAKTRTRSREDAVAVTSSTTSQAD